MSWLGRAPVRPALAALDTGHARAAARLHALSFAHGWSELEFEGLIAAPSGYGEAALDPRSGALLGFVLSRGAAGEAEVLTLAVDPAHRRRGIGRRLLDHHLARLARAGIGTLALEVEDANAAARALYGAARFAEVGRREAYYRGPDGRRAAALILRRATG